MPAPTGTPNVPNLPPKHKPAAPQPSPPDLTSRGKVRPAINQDWKFVKNASNGYAIYVNADGQFKTMQRLR